MAPSVRPAAVAGTFYPAHAGELRRLVTRLLDEAGPPGAAPYPKMLIVPHAAYQYSGAVAAQAYRTVVRRPTRRVVLLGPAHFADVPGVAGSDASSFATPLGEMSAQEPGVMGVEPSARAHSGEHSLEVQIPFLQALFGACSLVPLLCNRAPYAEVAVVLGDLLGGQDTLVVISTDLSHYMGYEAAGVRDGRTAGHIVSLEPEELRSHDACGLTALQAGLAVAAQSGWGCRMLDLRNSGDTGGPRDAVVGYGAFALGPSPAG